MGYSPPFFLRLLLLLGCGWGFQRGAVGHEQPPSAPGPSGMVMLSSTTVPDGRLIWGADAILLHRAGTAAVLFADHDHLLSVVGPWVSVESSWYSEGGAHPTYGRSWSVKDVRQPEATVTLRMLYDDATLFNALRNDPFIQQTLTDASVVDLNGLLVPGTYAPFVARRVL